MAPEVALSQAYSKSVDIWSTGIIMFEILTGGKHPLYESTEDDVDSYKKKL
jgi:serine/threonine protein kinase